ncbi:tetraspanin-1-like [Cynoglossus semilaevis]|uniref:Tetraspanin n=1 Tax=Cynoglossus semilaevis TaxID=244447 RepID=A0A3P8W1B7_CYNSE|nr:tetraspanin-1-like [Cynoglossus semilaevis]
MCCSGFLKIMMFIFNGGIFLAGAAILGMGIWVKLDIDSLLGLLGDVGDSEAQMSKLVSVSYVLIAVGAVLLVIGFLGCCGAIKESRCMLLTFFSIVLIIFIIEIAGAVVLLVFRGLADDILDQVGDTVKSAIKTKYGLENDFTSLWDSTMQQFECCGYTNYTDFTDSPFNKNGNYPAACCLDPFNGTLCDQRKADKADVDGCYDMLLAFIQENSVIIAAVALGILALEIAAMVVSMILYNNIGRKA